jgi:hypothetical protein
MKRLLLGLVRLYPRSWRERYEAELQLLLEDATPHWNDVFDVFSGGLKMRLLRSNLALVLMFGIAGSLLAAAALWAIPKRYESRATLSLQAADGRLAKETEAVLAERTLRPETLHQIIEEFGLYGGESKERAIESLRQDVSISPDFSALDGHSPGAAAVSIGFRYSEPELVTRVTRDLVARLIDENIRARGAEPLRNSSNEASPIVKLVSGATEPRPLAGPARISTVEIAFAESLQLGLIFALFRRRRAVAYT